MIRYDGNTGKIELWVGEIIPTSEAEQESIKWLDALNPKQREVEQC